MYILKIQLNNKTYGIEKLKASAIKKIIAFQKKNAVLTAQAKAEGEEASAEILDLMAEFLVSVYEHQFTEDELWDGLELAELQPKFDETINTIMDVFSGDTKKK